MKAVKKADFEKNAKAIIALLILALAFGLFLLFNAYQENIITSDSFQLFMGLSIIGGGLLVCLLYLVNNPLVAAVKKKKRTK